MLSAILLLAAGATGAVEPIELHPENPRYFRFRGKPTILVGSTEHYGAVLNLDFDAAPYFEELQARGLNLTRVFSGTYREVSGSFNIKDNTLAPKPGRFACPWARVGEKYDLDRWDDTYFQRLKATVAEAGRRGVVVEFTLFCPFYEEALWEQNPMNARNNTGGIGDCPRTEAFTLKHPRLLARQEAFVRKVVGELAGCDNLFYEICNEPYFGGVTPDWQARIAATIADAEKDLPHRHLIAQNIANGHAKVEKPDPAVSLFNFHYATPPDAVAENVGLKRPIGDDETGFEGTGDAFYRGEAWEFLLAGGALFDHLDYSFTVGHEDGSAEVSEPTPGGGGPALRRQFQVLKTFLDGFDFLHTAPDTRSIAGTGLTLQEASIGGIGVEDYPSVRCLSRPGKAYAIYVRGNVRPGVSPVLLAIDVPGGRFRAEWVNPRTGAVVEAQDVDHPGPSWRYSPNTPDYEEDIALRILFLPDKGE